MYLIRWHFNHFIFSIITYVCMYNRRSKEKEKWINFFSAIFCCFIHFWLYKQICKWNVMLMMVFLFDHSFTAAAGCCCYLVIRYLSFLFMCLVLLLWQFFFLFFSFLHYNDEHILYVLWFTLNLLRNFLD